MSRLVFVLAVAVSQINAQDAQATFTERMQKMTEGLSGGTLRDLGGITCWTCHRGNVKPARMPQASWEALLVKWPEELKVRPEDAKKSRRQVYKNIKSAPDAPAGSLPMEMSIFAAALGVGCEHCHVRGRWDSDEKPAKVTARLMLEMFNEIPRYFEQSRQPSMQCYTCHQGSPKPERHPG